MATNNVIPVDIFGETRIHIDGNPKLEGIANHILEIYHRDPDILNGDTIGQINRQIHAEVMLENGLTPVLKSGDIEKFKQWYLDRKRNTDTEEETARALRYLVENDYMRLPARAIQEAERHKQRISNSLSH